MNTIQSSSKHTILGHPDSLFVLFFTEMWERFSYYGMRALIVLFLVSELSKGGWGWSRQDALSLYGTYTGLVYFTPLIGGFIADQFLGTRRAVLLGGFIIASGHACLLFDTVNTFYIGLGLIIIGTGLFKPNISAIVGQLYDKQNESGRDSGYTLFYMGINSGAFFGIALCGYIGENVSWPFGFGLAGAFMLLGAVQFYFAQNIFGNIGLSKSQIASAAAENPMTEPEVVDVEAAPHIVKDRLLAIVVFSFFSIFFWLAFEQAGGSMTIFAADYTDRSLVGNGGLVFNVVNALIMAIPAGILSWLLVKLFSGTGKTYLVSNLLLTLALGTIWAIVIWMVQRQLSLEKSDIPASWFGILNSLFIVVFAPVVSKVWDKYWNPSGPIKFGVSLVLLGLGFAILAFGASTIPSGAKAASVGIGFLIFAYLFHTLGELCLSPVGLSYISKLAPPRLLGLMFGIWFLNTAIAQWLAGKTGSYIDHISETYSLMTFFLIYTAIPVAAGLVIIGLNKWLLRKMHGVF